MPDEDAEKLKIMVASTVYGFTTEIVQICAMLRTYGYTVLNSYLGTIPAHPGRSNLQNCVAAVGACDLFLGIIRPFYGTGVVGKRSITHEEMREAVRLNKPRWCLVHDHVQFARQAFKQYRVNDVGKRRRFRFKATSVMDDLRVIDMFDDVVQTEVPILERTGNWCQTFQSVTDVLNYVDAQLKDVAYVREICEEMKTR
jgi:hypothetical protein